jgi:hypothetical protein
MRSVNSYDALNRFGLCVADSTPKCNRLMLLGVV